MYSEGLREEFAAQPPVEDTVTPAEDDDEDDSGDVVRTVPLDQIGAKILSVQFG